MRRLIPVFFLLLLALLTNAGELPDKRFPLFEFLTGKPTPTMVTYTPSQLDPRQEVNQGKLATSSIRADLEALRPAFDGLVLYGYHEACTPRTLAVVKDLKFRAVLLGIWDIKSAAEIDGVSELVRQHEKDFALGVLVGNEGITFKRYEAEDLKIAAARLKGKLPKSVPISTSEPLVGYKQDFVRNFGDFLAPNIHPVFDRPDFDAEKAARWVFEEALHLVDQTRKPLLVKETGSPHGGKAAYTPQTQKAFWSAYTKTLLHYPSANFGGPWLYYGIAFDAFDLPWKAQESKLEIERYWGLFDEKRQPLPAFDVWRAAHGGAKAGGR
jgi:exo-beta-1,3-glucanase (GH17 family)